MSSARYYDTATVVPYCECFHWYTFAGPVGVRRRVWDSDARALGYRELG